MNPKKRLGEMLMEAGIIDETQLKAALGHQRQWGVRLGQALVDLKLATEADIVGALSVKFGFPIARLAELEPYALEQALSLVPREFAVRHNVFPMAADTASLTVAMSDPANLSLVDEIRFRTGRRVKVFMGGDREVADAVKRHYPAGEAAVEAIALDLDVDEGQSEAVFDPFGGGSKDALEAFFGHQQDGSAGHAPPAAPAPAAAPAPPAAAAAQPAPAAPRPRAPAPPPPPGPAAAKAGPAAPSPRPAPAAARPTAAAATAPSPRQAASAPAAARAAPSQPAPGAARAVPAQPAPAPPARAAPAAARPGAAAPNPAGPAQAPSPRPAPAPVAAPLAAAAPAAAPQRGAPSGGATLRPVDLELEEPVPADQAGAPAAPAPFDVAPAQLAPFPDEVSGSEPILATDLAPEEDAVEGRSSPQRPLTPDETAILDALDRLAGGHHAEPEIVKPAQAMAALVRLLLRKRIVSEQEFLDELKKK
ncbi:MAG TPA: hypothetical protein VIW03_00320 [Anaeromyxobacter sp.]